MRPDRLQQDDPRMTRAITELQERITNRYCTV